MPQSTGSPPIGRDVLCTLLPHAGSMCLLERIASWDAREIVCHAESHRASDNPLRLGARLDALNAIEYAAQAIAVHGSLLAPRDARPRGGFLASARQVRFAVARLDDIEATLVVAARHLADSEDGCSYDFEISARDAALVTGRLLIAYLKE